MILGYSRLKFLMLTRDRTQTTVFKGLLEFFKYIGGVPKEMLFDNMRTIVDRSRTQFNRAQYNERFYAFSKDVGFLPRSCLAYKPKTANFAITACFFRSKRRTCFRFKRREKFPFLIFKISLKTV